MDSFLYFTDLFIVGQSIHRLQLDYDITILYTATIIARISLSHFRIIRNHYLPIVFHILIRLFACFFLVGIISIRSSIGYIFSVILLSIQTIQLSFHKLEFILLSSLDIAHLTTCFRPIMISSQEVWILFNHFRIVANSPPIVACLCTQQTSVESSHHVVWLHLQHKIEIFNGSVVVSDLGA